MTLLKNNNYKDINIALLSLENDIKNKTVSFDTSVIDKQLEEINNRIDDINAGSNTSAEINDLRASINNINNTIADINSELSDALEDINSINGEINDLNTSVENLGTDVEDLEQKLSNIFLAENLVEDFNTAVDPGIYYWTENSQNRPAGYGILLVLGTDWINQTAYSTDGRIYFRQKINDGEWTSWQNIAYITDTVERAKGWEKHNLDLSELSTDNFYPVVIETSQNFLEVAIHSPHAAGTNTYNQNRIKFSVSAQGWSDTPVSIFISEYARSNDSATTIGSIGRTTNSFAGIVMWLRGGLTYTCYTMNSISAPYIITEDTFLQGASKVTVGPDYSGGYNSEVDILFTPDTTISEGSYFSRGLTSTNIKASTKLIIPIGEPATLEDGCIWIER